MTNLILILVSLFLVSCSHIGLKEKTSVVFIHGSHLDDTSWKPVIQQMDENRFKLKAIRVPKRDGEVFYTLADIAKLSCGEVERKSVIVVHSFGGVIANQMLGICPDKMDRIIYVTALVPFSGEGPFDLMDKASEVQYAKAVNFKADLNIPKSPEEFYRAMDEFIDVKKDDLPPVYSEPGTMGGEKLNFPQEKLEKIPKIYVHATKDLIVSMETQKKYTERIKFQAIEEVESGHLPMLSKPRELAQILTKNLEKNFQK